LCETLKSGVLFLGFGSNQGGSTGKTVKITEIKCRVNPRCQSQISESRLEKDLSDCSLLAVDRKGDSKCTPPEYQEGVPVRTEMGTGHKREKMGLI
jgi:hypothetical protein